MGRIISALTFCAVLAFSCSLEARAEVTAADLAKYDLASGEPVYNASCKGCHATGIMKAPKTGVKADWTARLGQGMATLVKNRSTAIKKKA